ncbi:succinyldiaminopimelate transaminase [Corynebacterium uberis]|uniref:succinyldiaminopimelate transaminase n=1 Tax=Corynebacterium TaxID=1716 RepID=UPI001D0BDA6B|nr:succinyldiaminopimelate transaminase [Corynebacterium uberis]MCZ9308945.1 succinyldiaminopimelate transaminase [Corynebacterium sp. c6VSa_13]UDL74584.1 succinyldiaminopimelate transaminase [Corynebacterium uberis]UDL76582.1 succinyldiaminopimelate transaminase [Corynebacterium uberis]UDL78795.1 succinyldiaminopimelate transaminase [Corynebacterium uberis]UDL81073.1 succinyldiaminopimelate transaminase [Corynebacterium uberis]
MTEPTSPTSPRRTPRAQTLPDFPWDTIAEAKATAQAHPEGMVNLSVGSPVDPVAPGIQLALAEAAGYPGYPQTIGTQQLRDTLVESLERRYGVTGLSRESVLPVVGTKEAIAWLPTTLGLGEHSTVAFPELAYPTYEVGAALAGAASLRTDDVAGDADLIFINSPANPTGRVLGVERLRELVRAARATGVILVSDECYLGLGWDDEHPPVSILDPRVCDGDHTGLLAVHSLSKTSNLASYRAGFLAGDPALIAELALVRKHAGLMVPYPVQAAMVAACTDDDQEALQKLRYASRRATLMAAVRDAGLTIEHSEAGLYLWATRGEDGRATVDWLAQRGILVAPGDFYGPSGKNYVRIALTATDEDIAAAAARLRD